MSKSKVSKSTQSASEAQLAAGMKKHYAETDTVGFGKPPATVAQVLALIQAGGDATLAADVAHGAWRNALEAARQKRAETERTVRDVVAWLQGVHGDDAAALTDFGLAPKKARRPLTVEEKQAAAVKRAATRKARGVMGSRQRKKVVAPPAPAEPIPAQPAKPPTPTHGAG
jgi:hypothetical protein